MSLQHTLLGLSSPTGGTTAVSLETHALRDKYKRANALVTSVLNKYYNGSARAVDPFVIRSIQDDETRLCSIQCFVEEGPAETRREHKESSVTTCVAKAPVNAFTRFFGVCGGFSRPGTVMRRWDELSDGSYDDAMLEYIAVVDKVVPGWDDVTRSLEYPIARQDRFWQDDASTTQCQYCGVPFSVATRRHHCRLCLDVFCAACCNASLEIALCPGAPIRKQRVCCQCFQDAEQTKSLHDVRRVMRENQALEAAITELQRATAAQLALKQHDERKLRQDARASGCDMDAVDASILKRVGSSVDAMSCHSSSDTGISSSASSSSVLDSSVTMETPPAHKFAPRETIEANEQLTLAHRKLTMGLKVAQCRAKRALDRVDATLTVLREAICFRSSNWSVVLRCMRRFLTLRDLHALALTSRAHCEVVTLTKSARRCVLEQPIAVTARPALWQRECLRDEKTRQYVTDLADAVCTRLDESDEEDEVTGTATAAAQAPHRPAWLLLLTVPLAPASRDAMPLPPPQQPTLWDKAYALILERCDASSDRLEFATQIASDVQRTFGTSALRKQQHKLYESSVDNTLTPPLCSELGLARLEQRRQALANVLRAFSSINTEIGYCQGMDHVAAILLSVVAWHEARAFWLLTSLVASPAYALTALWTPGLPHLALRCYQLERTVAMHLPVLSAYLRRLEFPISMFATSWFMTLFTNMEALTYDATLRVLDAFIVAGWKQLFRVALVILDMLQPHILASAFEEIPQLFYDIQALAPQLARADVVLTHAAHFKVTTSQLERFARDFEASIASNGANSVSQQSNSTAVAAVQPTPPLSQLSLSTADTSATNEQAESPLSTSSEATSSAVEPTNNSEASNTRRNSPPKQKARRESGKKKNKKAQLAAAKDDSNDMDANGAQSPDATRAATPLRVS